MHRLPAVVFILLISGCSTAPTHQRPPSYYAPSQEEDRAGETTPLFKGDGKLIEDGEIKRILDYRYVFPKQNRIAIFPLGQRAWWASWSNEFALMNADIERGFIGTLRGSKKVFDASYLPSILVPEKRTIPYLREAAARYQADLMLLYRADCKTYRNHRFLLPNETKAFCTVETVLLDTRTGIIPFTSVSTETFGAKQADGDLNFSETVHKAEIEAIGKALLASAQSLVAFMDAEQK